MKVVFKFLVVFIAYLLSTNVNVFGQNQKNDELAWSETRKLNANDFKIKVSNRNTPCFAQFYISTEIRGFDFLTNNFNQKVVNKMFTSASWIDTTISNREDQIRFQQILFDLSEVDARKIRKLLLERRGQIANGMDMVDQISKEVSAELSIYYLEVEKDFKTNHDNAAFIKWETKIKNELQELHEFRYENSGKIKRQK